MLTVIGLVLISTNNKTTMETETLFTLELTKSHLNAIIECIEENYDDDLEKPLFRLRLAQEECY